MAGYLPTLLYMAHPYTTFDNR